MPLPKGLARFNRVVTNRVVGPFAARLPGFAIVTHVGRRSGRQHSNPVNLFRTGDRYVIALTEAVGEVPPLRMIRRHRAQCAHSIVLRHVAEGSAGDSPERLNGGGRIRTFEGSANAFTARPL